MSRPEPMVRSNSDEPRPAYQCTPIQAAIVGRPSDTAQASKAMQSLKAAHWFALRPSAIDKASDAHAATNATVGKAATSGPPEKNGV